MSSSRGKRERPTRGFRWLGWGIVGYGLFLRLMFPGSDPVHPSWSGWLTDEGRWTELAREWALFGTPDLDSAWSTMHLLLAPAFQLLSAGVFEVAGVTFASARFMSQAAGAALLLLLAMSLARRLDPRAWLGVLLLVAVHPELVFFSRVAIPEMPALLLQMTAFLLLVIEVPTTRRSLLAGVLMAAGVAMKATIAPVAVAFLAVIWLARDAAAPGGFRRPAGAYVLGLVAPGTVVLLAALAMGAVSGSVWDGSGGLQSILAFARLDSLYGMAATLYRGPAASHVNLLLAAVLPVSLGVWLRGGAPSPTWRLFAGGVVWAMGWLIPWTLLDYFPDRYLVHVYLPLVIALGAGLTLLAAPEGRSLREGFHALSVPGRFLVAALAALPAAAVTAPAVLSLLDLSGISLVQFRFHLVLVVGMALGVGARFATTGRMPLGVATVFFPMAVAVLLGLGNGPGIGNRWLGEHWRVDAAEVLGPWTLTLAGGAALAFAAARAGRGRDAHGRILGWSLAYAVGLAAVWTVTNHLPTLARRTYAVEGVAAELSERYGPDQLLGVSQAASILIGTPFRYRELSGDAAAPDVILTATHAGLRHPVLERILAPYRLVREYELPGLEYLPASRSPPVVVGLYERVDPPVGAGMSPGAGRLGLVAGEPTAGAPAPPGFSAPSPGVRR